MSKLDQPLKVKHGLAAVAAALTLGAVGTAIPMAAAGGGGGLHYVEVVKRVDANSQEHKTANCPAGTKVVGGGVDTNASFSSAAGMMVNTSAPMGNDAWHVAMDVFGNAGGRKMFVHAICKG